MQNESFDELFERFIEFSKTAFPDAKAESYLNKLKEETHELCQDPNMEELADCLMVIMGLSRFLPGDLKQTFAEKLKVNENRVWQKQEDGTYHHIPKKP